MKKRLKHSIYFLMLIGVMTVFTSSCGKDEVDSDTETETETFTDARDDRKYKIVTIGDQVWMAENLKYLPSVVGPNTGSGTTPYYYVYDYDGTSVPNAKATANYRTYGVLYNWEAARTACPNGWHLPSDAEWTQLGNYLGGPTVAGGKLKEEGFTHWLSPNTGATNEIGFTALPGGYLVSGGFAFIGNFGNWWADSKDASLGYSRWLNSNTSVLLRITDNTEKGQSVCCVKD